MSVAKDVLHVSCVTEIIKLLSTVSKPTAISELKVSSLLRFSSVSFLLFCTVSLRLFSFTLLRGFRNPSFPFFK